VPCVIVVCKEFYSNWLGSYIVHCNILHINKVKAHTLGAICTYALWFLYLDECSMFLALSLYWLSIRP
jgi:hypothetical protein